MTRPTGFKPTLSLVLQAVLLLLPLGYAGAHAWTYQQSNVPLAFESPYCHYAPVDDTPLVDYLKSQHVQYAWSTNWIAYRVIFETQSRIVISDVMGVTPPYTDADRIPSNTQAVSHADRPALVLFVSGHDSRPAILSELDAMGVQYRSQRFAGMMGEDILVVIPLNRTVSPLASPKIASNFTHCDI